MNHLLKFNRTDEQKHYFCSDLHYNHNPKWKVPLWAQRGYASVEEMNEHQKNEINRVVRPNDVLWHLGDISLNCSEEQFDAFLSSINCNNIYTLWGNHNSPSWKIYQREVNTIMESCSLPFDKNTEIYPLRYKNLVFIGNYQELVLDGQYIVMTHYPIYVWNEMRHGTWHLCGHSHYNCPFSKADNSNAKILDIGWDGKLGVYSMEDLRSIMNNKKVFDAGDHHII